MKLNKTIFVLLLCGFSACGVKGKPLPPLNPAPIGRGEPTFRTSDDNKSEKEKVESSQAR